MTTEEIILAVCGLAVAFAGAAWARWSRWRLERENSHERPAE